MCVIYFVWYFSIFLLYFSKILATNIDSITSYSKIREEIKSMYVCMYVPILAGEHARCLFSTCKRNANLICNVNTKGAFHSTKI